MKFALKAHRPGETDLGPGVWDIPSRRVPPLKEMERLVELADTRAGRP